MSLLIVIIAVSLSMDAFSLSLAYGTYNLSTKNIILLSLIVSAYHFFMPLVGLEMGEYIFRILKVSTGIIVFVVLLFIGAEMIYESFKNKEIENKNGIIEYLIFGFAVSIDSFSVGIGLHSITDNIILSSLIFSVTSGLFTYLGLILGKKINSLIGKVSTIIGGITLIVIGIIYLI